MRTVDLERYPVGTREFSARGALELGRYIGIAPIEAGPDLYAYTHLRSARVLRVSFHSAIASDTYPRFDRISTSEDSGDAYMLFADPTIAASAEVTLGWYLGGANWDPIDVIRDLILRAAKVVGAQTVVLVGGSGGGFAALRVGLGLPDALVYCFNPQTAVLNYKTPHIQRYFKHLHGADAVPEEIVASDPKRFDLVHAFASATSMPAIFYTQSVGDGFHMENHYVPFKRAMGVRGVSGASSVAPRVRFELFDGERTGHNPPSPSEFEQQYMRAIRWLLEVRSGPASYDYAREQDDDEKWTRISSEMSRMRREIAAIQSGEHSRSLRRRVVSDLMAVMAIRSEPIDRRPVLSGWAMSPVALKHVLELAEDAPAGTRVVEFGSGASTVWLADIIRRRTGALRFTSFEHDAEFFESTRLSLSGADLDTHVDLRLAELSDLHLAGKDWRWYSAWEGPRDASLVIVDGPPGGTGPMARFPALSFIESRAVNNGVVVVDDFGRADEASMVDMWNETSDRVRLELIELVDRAASFRVHLRSEVD